MTQKSPIEKAADILGGAVKLAALLDVSAQVVSNWKARGAVPIERCVAIEIATGGQVTRRDLRPDDWRDIWPELDEQTPRTPNKHPSQRASDKAGAQ